MLAGPIPLGPPATVQFDRCGLEEDSAAVTQPPFEGIFRALDALAVGETMRLSVDHDPEPLLAAIESKRPREFRWEPLLRGPVRWVGLVRRWRADERSAPVRRLSPRLARRVSATEARARLGADLRSIALDLIGSPDPAALPPGPARWARDAADEAVAAVRDQSLSALVERLDAILATAPADVSHCLDEAADRQEAGLI